MNVRFQGSAALVARPVAWLYGAAVGWRNRRYDRGRGVLSVPVPVISIGNLTVGGTGKTPMAHWLARALRDEGHRPAIVSRGYRGRAGRGPLVVSYGDGPRVDAATGGDEPVLLAGKLPTLPVVVGSDRVAGARAAIEAGATVILLDDGFQHRRLARDLDIVLLDAADPFGGGHMLPVGRLREPVSALSRAGAIVVTRCLADDPRPRIEPRIRQIGADAPIVRARTRRAGYSDGSGLPAPRPSRALAFCGIANPDAFRDDLVADGIDLIRFRVFRDHHPYTIEEWQRLVEEARREGAMLLTTEKDNVRLPRGAEEERSRRVLSIEIEVLDAPVLLERVRAAISRGRA